MKLKIVLISGKFMKMQKSLVFPAKYKDNSIPYISLTDKFGLFTFFVLSLRVPSAETTVANSRS